MKAQCWNRFQDKFKLLLCCKLEYLLKEISTILTTSWATLGLPTSAIHCYFYVLFCLVRFPFSFPFSHFFALPSWTNSFGIWYFLFSFVIINIFPLCVGGGGWTSLESPFLRATFRMEMQIVIDYAAHKPDRFELESWRPFINLIITILCRATWSHWPQVVSSGL